MTFIVLSSFGAGARMSSGTSTIASLHLPLGEEDVTT
jgi:hypothetical protein